MTRVTLMNSWNLTLARLETQAPRSAAFFPPALANPHLLHQRRVLVQELLEGSQRDDYPL